MRNVRWLAVAGLLVSAAGCTAYPGTGGYGGYPSGYGQPAYYGGQQDYSNGGGLLNSLFGGQSNYQPAPTYYQPQQTYYQPPQTTYYQQPQTRYVPVASPQAVTQPRYAYTPTPVQQSRRSSWGSRDSDGDGIPNRYDRDRNNDGIPDRQQRRGSTD